MDALYIFIFIGPIILILGIIMLIKRKKFVSQSKIIRGKVIDNKKGYINNHKTYFPVIEYTDDDLSIRTFQSSTGYNPPKYKVGDVIEVRYYADGDNKHLAVNTWFAIWGVPAIFIPIGILFSIIGTILLAFI